MNKIIVRIKGGIGNQLFCYAAARRLSLVNNVELVIDNVTGFVRDKKYQRQYSLDHFNIPVRKATSAERMEPFERYRRGVMKWLSRRKPFEKRHYLEQEGTDFDERLLTLMVKKNLYLDGLWQSEEYFKDEENAIREDLQISPPTDALNLRIADEIRNGHSVALHVRWFDESVSSSMYNVSAEYYQRAIALMEEKIVSPRYFIFSDDPEATRAKLSFPKSRTKYVTHNHGVEMAIADMWLMSQCQHFITANSTFSWWGAWLGGFKHKIVICPGMQLSTGKITSWNFPGQLPYDWIKL
jgi:hypothetical protein